MAKSIIFILPKNTKHALVDDCWEFYSDQLISNIVVEKLIETYNLEFMEEFLEIIKYENTDIDMNVNFTDKKITEIYIRTSIEKDVFVNQLSVLLKDDEVEIFIPDTLR